MDSPTVKTLLTMFAKTNRKSAVWFPCLAATFSSATSATCKYLCATELEVLLLTSYLLAGPINFEVTSKTNTSRNEQNYIGILVGLPLQIRVIIQPSFFLQHTKLYLLYRCTWIRFWTYETLKELCFVLLCLTRYFCYYSYHLRTCF